jgi:hypothetical protein
LEELHREPDWKLNFKFEVKVLCKTLAIEIHDVKPGVVFKDPVTFGTAVVPSAITTNVSTSTTIANHSATAAAADNTTQQLAGSPAQQMQSQPDTTTPTPAPSHGSQSQCRYASFKFVVVYIIYIKIVYI